MPMPAQKMTMKLTAMNQKYALQQVKNEYVNRELVWM